MNEIMKNEELQKQLRVSDVINHVINDCTDDIIDRENNTFIEKSNGSVTVVGHFCCRVCSKKIIPVFTNRYSYVLSVRNIMIDKLLPVCSQADKEVLDKFRKLKYLTKGQKELLEKIKLKHVDDDTETSTDYNVKGASNHECSLIVVARVMKDGYYPAFTRGKPIRLSLDDKRDLLSKPKSEDYLVVQPENTYRGTDEEYYDTIIRDADDLKRWTYGKVNMYRSGTYKTTALQYCYDLLRERRVEIAPIELHETDFLKNCGGAFRLAVPYEGPLYKYDARSFYPSIYSSSSLNFPVRPGVLKTVTQKEFEGMRIYPYGVYRCEVEKPKDEQLARLIYINSDKYYTHAELRYYKEKGISITIIEEPNNVLLYDVKDLKRGSELFGKYVRTLYELKERRKVPGAKKLLNYLWGVLVKTNRKIVVHNINDAPRDDLNVVKTKSLDEDHELLYHIDSDKPFDTDLARIKPFFLAQCRLIMMKAVEPYIDSVKYSHTDSVISSVELPFEDTQKLPSFRYEGFCKNGYVKNHNVKSPNNQFKM